MNWYKQAKRSEMEVLKKNKLKLDDSERQKCIEAHATWNFGPNGAPSPACWKSKNTQGDVLYVCNTHRCYQTAKTIEGCIKLFHDVVKETA